MDDFLHCGDELFYERVMKPLVKRFLVGRCSEKRFTYIGLHIMQDDYNEIYLDQTEYSKSIEEPQVSGKKGGGNIDLTSDQYTVFRALVGALNWLVCGSRPDLAYDVLEHSSKFTKATCNDLNKCVKSVKKCKRDNVVNKFSALKLDSLLKIVLFSDASYANLPDLVSSCLGYIVFLMDSQVKMCSTELEIQQDQASL